MKIFVIRHGESETNRDALWTGWYDAHLTEKGRSEAERLRVLLSGIQFDKIYSSDLLRAMETAEIAIPGCTYEISDKLRELNVGELTRKPFSILTAEQNDVAHKEGFEIYGGETMEEFCKRITDFFESIEKCDYERVAVFSHGGLMRRLLNIVVGLDIPGDRVCCRNCAVAVFEYSEDKLMLHSWINIS